VKFHVSWDSLEKENRFLKVLVSGVLILAISLCIVIMSVGSKDPLLIERGCYSRVVQKGLVNPSDAEIKAFVEEAVKARFTTGWSNPLVLTSEQNVFKEKEQAELTKQKMKQRVIVNDVTIGKESILVDADRLISVGDIRSTFKFPLKMQLKTGTRSEENPYGLLLSEVDEVSEVKK
jgi:hypothetical protein